MILSPSFFYGEKQSIMRNCPGQYESTKISDRITDYKQSVILSDDIRRKNLFHHENIK